MSRIEGKVAALLTEQELVLNVGELHGVEVGMRFEILYPGGLSVPNPDRPGETLGSVEWPKLEVKVVRVQDVMSVARTFRTVTIPASGRNTGFASLSSVIGASNYVPERREIETFRSEGRKLPAELKEEDSFVKVGDPAVQVVPIPDESALDS